MSETVWVDGNGVETPISRFMGVEVERILRPESTSNIRPYHGAPLAEYDDGRQVLHLEAGHQVRIDGVECVVVSVGVSEISTRPVTDAD